MNLAKVWSDFKRCVHVVIVVLFPAQPASDHAPVTWFAAAAAELNDKQWQRNQSSHASWLQNQTAFSQAVCAFSTRKCQICNAVAPSSSCGLCVLRAPLPRSAMANCCQSSLGAHSLPRFEPCACARSQGSSNCFHSFSNIIAPQAGANKAVQTQIVMRYTKSVAKVAVHEHENIPRFGIFNSGASLEAAAYTLNIRH